VYDIIPPNQSVTTYMIYLHFPHVYKGSQINIPVRGPAQKVLQVNDKQCSFYFSLWVRSHHVRTGIQLAMSWVPITSQLKTPRLPFQLHSCGR